jgi:hypothetical protein
MRIMHDPRLVYEFWQQAGQLVHVLEAHVRSRDWALTSDLQMPKHTPQVAAETNKDAKLPMSWYYAET